MSEVDYEDVQGLVRFGYKRMTKASYALVRVKDPAAAKAWLRTVPVTSAVTMDPPPKSALHVAFTVSGLRALGVAEAVIEGFSHEFRDGMVQEYRSRQLGDVEANDPKGWDWGSPPNEPHLLVMFFAEPGCFESLLQDSTGAVWNEAFEVLRILGTADMDGVEPFGFSDGVSQPTIDWEQQRKTTHAEFEYTNIVALGEFLLGYPNEYGKITDRPVIEADASERGTSPATDAPEKKDLGRNGTYLVMRQLDQDVRKFWQVRPRAVRRQSCGSRETRDSDGGPDERRRSFGSRTRFSYSRNRTESGADSAKPIYLRFRSRRVLAAQFGAHVDGRIREMPTIPAGPTSLFKKLVTMLGFGPRGFRDDLMSSVRFHRILRRGREYGRELKPEDALSPTPADDPVRGLHFICINANISRQFEFLQNAWMASTKFSGLTDESDPVLGTSARVPRLPGHEQLHHSEGWRLAPAGHWIATVCHCARRCLFLPAQLAGHPLLRRTLRRPNTALLVASADEGGQQLR
jgi:hypothetical protein